MIRIFRGNEEYVRLAEVEARVDKTIEEQNKRLIELHRRILILEAELAQPKLQALLDEYKRFGGSVDYEICDGVIALPGFHGLSGYFYRPDTRWNEDQFRRDVLVPQKAQWAEEHECPPRGRK